MARFHDALIDVLRRRYRDHWFPEKPFKGSGFRCIRINGKFDPMIGEAGESAGLSAKFLHAIFPSELTLWVDPLEVSYRIGENGSICVLYEHQDGVSEWKPNLTQLNKNQNKVQQQQQHYSKSVVTTQTTTAVQQSVKSPSCKDSIRDYLLIDRKTTSIEQLAAFVSS